MGASVRVGSRGRRGGIVGINVTPMVDVMLVLLVIMMVRATYIVSRALKVELPKSASSDESSQGPITVAITKDHHDFVNQEPVAGDAELVAASRGRTAKGEPSLVVSADARRDARLGRSRDRSRQAQRHHQVRHQRPGRRVST